MAEDGWKAEDYQDDWDNWYKDYEVYEFLENSEDNWEKVQQMDEHLVWTDHSTCEEPRVSAGASMFKNSCCWETYGWYISKKPWDEEFLYVYTGAYLPCPKCNADGEGDGDPDCDEEDCEDGYIHYWFD